jgi:predicted TIM-barrel fold metal-dependent hydrolase
VRDGVAGGTIAPHDRSLFSRRPEGLMAVYDAHAYLGNNPAWAQSGLPVPLDADGWIGMMDRSGVYGALVAPPGVGKDEHFRPDMDRIAVGIKKYPGRLFGMCRVRPRSGRRAVDELRFRVEEQGFSALKMNTLDDDYRLDDRKLLDPVLETAVNLNILLYFHTGDRHGETCQPRMIGDIADDFPQANFNIGHVGYPGWTDQIIPVLKKSPNTHVETAGVFLPALLQGVIDEVGPTRVMIGSNGPNSPIELPHVMVNKYMNRLSPHDKALVVGGNFRRVLRLDTGSKDRKSQSKRRPAQSRG